MEIRDLDMIENMDMLFVCDLVIWGGGKEGEELINLLEQSVGITPACICDKDSQKWNTVLRGVKVCSVKDLEEKTEEYIVIISSTKYLDEMYDDILQSGIIPRGIYTRMSVWYAVHLNLEDARIKPFYKDLYNVCSYYEAKKIWDEMTFYSLFREAKPLFAGEKPVLVLQPGKVGSNTVFRSLAKRGIDTVHLHVFPECLREHKRFIQEKLNPVKIITLVREPIARDISDFIQYFEWDYLMTDRMHLEKMDSNIEDRLIDSLRNQCNMGDGLEFDWFHTELEPLTGIDVFRYPFDKDKGYGLIMEGKYEILVLTLEKLKENSQVIGDFCEIDNFVMENANEGKRKRYKYLYANLMKKVKIPQDVLDKYYYGNKSMDYFYSDDEKKEFLERYT